MRPIRCCAVALMVLLLAVAGCSGPIPKERVPDGWALDVHQPGEWWKQPLIPRSVVVQRCPPPTGFESVGLHSEPNLSALTGLPPGTSVNYLAGTWTDTHCDIGWSLPAIPVRVRVADLATEGGLRRLCSSTGLPLDSRWRYLGRQSQQNVGLPPEPSVLDGAATAAFVNQVNTVVACMVGRWEGNSTFSAVVEPSLGGPGPAVAGEPSCPVRASDPSPSENDTIESYSLRGAGAVRGANGRLLTAAATIELGLAGDKVTSKHRVRNGIAIVDAWVGSRAGVPFVSWDVSPPIVGRILAKDGTVLATCRS